MAASTKYTLTVNDTATDFARTTKATVVAEADKRRKAGEKGAIKVVTQTGHVAYELKAIKARVITFQTKPYTKTIELPEDLKNLVPEGYVSAYARLRNGAVVLRREADVEEDDSRYAVLDVVKGKITGYAPTTRAAGQIMKSMKPAKVTVAVAS